MAKNKYVVRVDGVVVAQRSTDRVYQYAVVVVCDAAAERAHIARPAAEHVNGNSVHNYEYLVKMAAAKPGDLMAWRAVTAEDIADAKAAVANGYVGYMEQMRAKAIAAFEKHYAGMDVSYGTLGWCGRLDLAEKLKDGHKMQPFWKELLILPVEVAPAYLVIGA